jgi:hypothetical protein
VEALESFTEAASNARGVAEGSVHAALDNAMATLAPMVVRVIPFPNSRIRKKVSLRAVQ